MLSDKDLKLAKEYRDRSPYGWTLEDRRKIDRLLRKLLDEIKRLKENVHDLTRDLDQEKRHVAFQRDLVEQMRMILNELKRVSDD